MSRYGPYSDQQNKILSDVLVCARHLRERSRRPRPERPRTKYFLAPGATLG
jgi:hypothetical protein